MNLLTKNKIKLVDRLIHPDSRLSDALSVLHSARTLVLSTGMFVIAFFFIAIDAILNKQNVVLILGSFFQILLLIITLALFRLFGKLERAIVTQLLIVLLGSTSILGAIKTLSHNALLIPASILLVNIMVQNRAKRWFISGTAITTLVFVYIYWNFLIPAAEQTYYASKHLKVIFFVSVLCILIGEEIAFQRKLFADQIQQNNRKWELALNNTSLGVWEWNQKTNKITATQQLAELSGLKLSVFQKENIFEKAKSFVTTQDYATVRSALQRLTLTDQAQRCEIAFKIKDRVGYVEIFLTHYEVNNAIRLVAIVRDITEKRHMANRRNEFIAMASHELRTPVSGMLGIIHLLAATKLNDKQTHWIKRLQASSNYLAEIVRNTLDFSVLNSEQVTLKFEKVDIRKLISEIIILFAPKLPEKVDLASWTTTEVPNTIVTDHARLRQMLINLIGNALKFTEDGYVSIEISKKNEFISIAIKDTGIGIETKFQENLFFPFQQVDGSRQRVYGGQGLGLAISRQIISRLGGDLSFKSTYKEGSTFTAMLPIQNQQILAEQNDHDSNKILDIFPKQEQFFVRKTIVTTERRPATKQLIQHTFTSRGGKVVLIKNRLDFVRKFPDPTVIDLFIWSEVNTHNSDIMLEIKLQKMTVPSLIIRKKYEVSFSKQAIHILQYPIDQKILLQKGIALFHNKSASFVELQTHSLKQQEPILAKKYPLQILIVEDDATNRSVTVNLLRMHGYDPIAVVNGEDAIEHVQIVHFDLVLMDVHMPIMDGIEATHFIRSLNEKIRQPKIFAFTADASVTQSKLLKWGFDGILEKPFVMKNLIQILDETYANKNTVEEQIPLMFAQLLQLFADEPDELKKLIEKYLLNGNEILTNIEEAINKNDTEKLRFNAHRWKSSSTTVGAVEVSEICDSLQKLAKKSEIKKAKQKLPSLQKAHDSFHKWVFEMLKK